MKKRISIIILATLIIILLLTTFLQKEAIPDSLIDSTIHIVAYYSNGKISSGSAFALSKTSSTTYFVTCDHVVDDVPDRILVVIGEEQYEATKLCSDELNDIAVVSVDADIGLEPLPLTEAGIGSKVYAAGFPVNGWKIHTLYFEDFKTVTTGRMLVFTGGLFGTQQRIICTAPCGEGMSGGPVVNSRGEVIGIVASGYDDKVGAASAVDILNLCKENNIPYTHNISIRLIRDGVVIVLFLAIVWIATPADDKKKIEEKKK